MKTDPRIACENVSERKGWAFLHDAIAHPLMALTNWSAWSMRFHDWTSHRAWPRVPQSSTGEIFKVRSKYHGELEVKRVARGVYQVKHSAIEHWFTTKALDILEAAELAEVWFLTLSDVGIFPDGVRT